MKPLKTLGTGSAENRSNSKIGKKISLTMRETLKTMLKFKAMANGMTFQGVTSKDTTSKKELEPIQIWLTQMGMVITI